ncbi:MAG: LamG domain-containing protein [Bacteroidota bacterium]|jgi:hypothetical protein
MKRLIIPLILLSLSFSLQLFSQTKMMINKNNGTSDSLNLSDIKSITFNISSSIPTSGLVAYYPFNGNANDGSGNGHNGTVYGASLSTDRFGQSNRSMYFDGATNYIDIGAFGPINDETVSLWFKKAIATNYPSSGEKDLIGTQNSCNITYKVGFHQDQKDKILFSVADSGCTPYNRYKMPYTNSPIADTNWHHLVLMRSVSVAMLIYVDNQLSATSLWGGSSNPNAAVITGSNTFIGQGGSVNPNSHFSGKIDDIRIYNRFLTTIEIQALFHEGGW